MPIKPGRPPFWLIEEARGGAFIDACEIVSRDRFALPALAQSGWDWLDPGAEVLLVLEDVGRASLVRWGLAQPIRDRARELNDAIAAGDTVAAGELLQLQYRYRRLKVDADSRVQLPLTAIVHLDVHRAVPATVYVVRYPERVELWSRTHSERLLDRALLASRDAP